MFEQSLYNQEAFAPVPEAHEGDLFYRYEIKNWNLGSRIYKILVISALVNVLFFAFVAQTNLLTRKGCESPITSTVCQVIDMAFVADTIFGTKRDYVDEVYEKTSLKDADVTFVDVSNAETQLEYPEGYFALENPEQAAMLAQLNNTNNGYTLPPPMPQTDLLHTTPIIPKANPNAVDGDIPTSPLGDLTDNSNSSIGPIRKVRGPRKFPSANTGNGSNDNTVQATATPNPSPITSNPVADVTINREVLKGWGKDIADKVDKKEVDLSKNFSVVADVTLTPDGKLDNSIDKKTKQPKSQFVKWEGDPQMIDVVKSAIEAIGDSGWLGYLKNQGVDRARLTFTQDDQQLYVVISSEMTSEEKARSVSSGLNGLIQGALIGANSNFIKLGDDEKTLLANARVTPDKKVMTLNFSLPKPLAQEMINRNVEKAKQAETGSKPNSMLQEPALNQNTARK